MQDTETLPTSQASPEKMAYEIAVLIGDAFLAGKDYGHSMAINGSPDLSLQAIARRTADLRESVDRVCRLVGIEPSDLDLPAMSITLGKALGR